MYVTISFCHFKICTRCHLKQREDEICTEKALIAIEEAKYGKGRSLMYSKLQAPLTLVSMYRFVGMWDFCRFHACLFGNLEATVSRQLTSRALTE